MSHEGHKLAAFSLKLVCTLGDSGFFQTSRYQGTQYLDTKNGETPNVHTYNLFSTQYFCYQELGKQVTHISQGRSRQL